MYETEVKRCYCCERELELNSHHLCWESLNWPEKQIQELWPSPLVSLGICSDAHILPLPTKMLPPLPMLCICQTRLFAPGLISLFTQC